MPEMGERVQPRHGGPLVTWVLIIIVILLAVLPFVLQPKAKFNGADNAAQDAIGAIKPGTRPWFSPLWRPPSSETESLLFALQAALGAGVIGYFFGYKRGERRGRMAPSGDRELVDNEEDRLPPS